MNASSRKNTFLLCVALLGATGLPADELSAAFGQAQGLVNQAHAQGVNTGTAQQQLNQAHQQYLAWQAQQARQNAPRLQTIDPFGDYLFHGVSIQPADGKLVTRSWDNWGQNQFGPMQAPTFPSPDAPGGISKSPLSDPSGGGLGPRGKPIVAMAVPPPPEVDDGAVRIGSGKVDLLRQQDPNAKLQENSGVRQAVEEAKYAHMTPAELDAVAAANPDLKQAIQKQKALNQSRDSLGALGDQVAAAQDAATTENEQKNHDLIKAGAIGAGMAGLPGAEKMVEHAQGEATSGQVLGDVAKDYVVDQGKDLVVDVAKELGKNVPLVRAALAVPDGIKAGEALSSGLGHYGEAKGYEAQVQAAGGAGNAIGKWSTAINQAGNQSAQIYQQVPPETTPIPMSPPPLR